MINNGGNYVSESKGIDVSHHQGEIDFSKVKADGVRFVMLRAGYGWENPEKQTDRMFYRNYRNAVKAGLPCGAYHYSYARNVREAELEADFFLKIIKGCQFAYPVAFDLEDKTQAGLSRKTLTDIIIAFCDKLEKAGYYVCFYTNPDWMKNKLDMQRLKRFDLWLARYSNEPGYSPIGMWQYSSTGRVDGIKTPVDRNLAYRDYPLIIRKAGLNGFPKV
jgi:lysozyme